MRVENQTRMKAKEGVRSPCAVVSQPMYFPWIGLLEQIRLCDNFVFYDDVQYARGFFNRVQVKMSDAVRWMTVPLRDYHRGQLINEVHIDDRIDWRSSHIGLLRQAYAQAPYRKDMLDLVDEVFSSKYEILSELSIASTMALVTYFGMKSGRQFELSSEMDVDGTSTKRLINVCKTIKASTYLTGHGAKNYLDHDRFESAGIDVTYIDYQLVAYPQLHGDFTPYVTCLDLVANCGRKGAEFISGSAIHWKEFLSRSADTGTKE